jgi:uncharacterized membrane protein YgcG
VAGLLKLETTMKKFHLLVATSVGVLGVFMTANAFANQVSDHAASVTATTPNDDRQDASTGDQNDDSAVESDDSTSDQKGDGVDAGPQKGDKADNAGDDSRDHESGDSGGSGSNGGGGNSGGGGGGDD